MNQQRQVSLTILVDAGKIAFDCLNVFGKSQANPTSPAASFAARSEKSG